MFILTTGGAAYIGSHTFIALGESGFDFVVYGNLSNSSKESIKRVEKIINKSVPPEEADIRDKNFLKKIFKDIDSVIHFAGLNAIRDSIEKTLEYYDNNVVRILALLKVMKDFDCKEIVFSSSSTVYRNLINSHRTSVNV